MTTIVIRKKENSYSGFYCMGHAEYAKKNQPDILCASISAIVIGTINALDDLAGEELAVETNEKTGFIKCDFLSDLQEKSIFLIDSMIYNLKNISNEYGSKYLQVKFEEV